MGAVHSVETVLPEQHRLTHRKFIHDQFRTTHQSPHEIRVMTYNIRYDNPDDAKDGWPNRKELVKDVVVHHRPDIVGFQECLPHQHKFLENELVNHKYCQYGLARQCNSNRYVRTNFVEDCDASFLSQGSVLGRKQSDILE
jgi:hypothetical protein